LYFVESFKHLLDEVKQPEPIVADCLKQLIHKKYVVSLIWNDEKQDYVKTFMYDTDNMHNYYYLATKDGLMAHNSK
jgi:uncharacterized protein YhbP (UPF0306 family)